MNIRAIISNVSCFVLVLILSLVFITNTVSAETKTFIKEYTYQASDEDSKNSSRTIALREVKRLILEELGTYLESTTEVKNFKLTKDQIVALTAGIVQTELIEEKWNTENLKYWLKAKITADSSEVIRSINSLRKDREKVKELEGLRKKSEELLKENERLNKELKTAKGDAKQKAAKAYNRNIDDLNATEWLEKGNKLGTSGNYIDAEKAYSKAIELNPQDAYAYSNRGVIYDKLGNTQQAINDYNRAIELNPQLAYAYYNRGVTYGEIGNYQQAIIDYNKAIELNPNYAAAYVNVGCVYYNLGDYRQAIKDYNKAIELDPQYAKAYNNRGATYGELGNYRQAIKDYNKAIELNPQLVDAYGNRGVAYKKLGSYQQAVNDYNKAIELNPQDTDTCVNRGNAYVALGNYQQAIKDFNKAIELNPQDALAYYSRGIAYAKLGNKRFVDDFKIAARFGDKAAQDFLRSKGIEW